MNDKPYVAVGFSKVVEFRGLEYGQIPPDEWLEDPHWACGNGHVSSRYLKTDGRGDRCLACPELVCLVPPGTTEEELKEYLGIHTLKIDELEVGSKVHYQPPHYGELNWENGIVKEIRDGVEDSVWVVYNCDGEWSRYREFTSAKTNLSDLKLGWENG